MTAADAEFIDAAPVNAFTIVNYRRFFIGQSLSNIGTWFQLLAQALLVLKLTHRASSLGEAFALQTLPMLLLGPFIGAYIDRANIRRILIVISVISGCEAFALSALVVTHHVTVLWILGLSFVLGFAQMFQQPCNQTIISELVPATAISSAVSLGAVQQAIGRLAGPAAAGLLYAWSGASTCYFVNGISYVVVVLSLFSLRTKDLYPRKAAGRSGRNFLDAINYAFTSPLHRGQLIANAFIGCLAFNFPIFYSSFTQLVLHSGSASFGIAESINAAFAVSGGLILARLLHHPTRRLYVIACFALSAALANIALAPNITVFYIDMAFFGLAVVGYMSVNQSVLQLNTPSDRMGSIMTLSSYGTQGTTPIGSLIVGWLIGVGTARAAIGLGAATALVAGLVLLPGLRGLQKDNDLGVAAES